MMLASVLHLLLASAAGDLGTPPARRRANGTDFRRQYFSRPVRRPGAVNEAVELLTQQEAVLLAAAPARPRVYDDGPAIDGALPTCRVTHERMAAEGTFRRRASKKAPYNTTCFFFRPRYHDAPACGGPTEAWPDWGWDYTLESAVRGRCKMPDPTPTRAARAFFEARPTGVKTEDRTLTVVMLGLSFMGQPYASLACLHQDLVVNGTSYHAKLTEDAPYGRTSLADIRKDGGACLGNVDRDKIRDAFPAATHPPSFPLPRQNAYRCSYDHSMIEYHEPGEPRVRVCYRYTFNMAKNLRPGSSLPCDLAWADIDIVLHAFPGEHFRELFLKRTGAPPQLSTILVSVVNICVKINQCVGCTRQFFTKSFLGDDAAVLARSSGEEPASPHHQAGVASMAWRTTRRFSTNAP